MQRIEVVRIEFYESSDNTTTNYIGPNGYSIRPGSSGAMVTFQINENRQGQHIQLTEIVEARCKSYDEVVRLGYVSLRKRLEGYGRTAEALLKSEQEQQSKPAA